MPPKTQTKVIAGQEWSVTPITGGLAFDHSPWVLGLIATGTAEMGGVSVGDILSTLATSAAQEGGMSATVDGKTYVVPEAILALDIGRFGGALAALCAKLPPGEARRLRTMLFEGATVDVGGRPLAVLTAMDSGDIKGGVPAMWQGLVFALVLSFGPFGSGGAAS